MAVINPHTILADLKSRLSSAAKDFNEMDQSNICVLQSENTNDKVEVMKRKVTLQEKALEVHNEKRTVEIDFHDHYIKLLRSENDLKRKVLALHKLGENSVKDDILEAGSQGKFGLLKPLVSLSTIQEEKEANKRRALNLTNLVRYENEKLLNRLEKKVFKYEGMNRETQPLDSVVERAKKCTQIENSMDKEAMRYTTAKIITNAYKDVISYMQEEAVLFPRKLDTMEATLLDVKKEIVELKQQAQEAELVAKDSKYELKAYEQELFENRMRRDNELSELRKEVEIRKQEMDKADKTYRAQILSELQETKSPLDEPKQKALIERQQKLMSYEEALQIIKRATHIADMQDLVDRCMAQKEIKEKLDEKKRELEVEVGLIKDNKLQMLSEYKELKYNGYSKISRGEQLLEEMQDKLFEQEEQTQDVLKNLDRNAVFLNRAKIAIHTLLSRLEPIRLKPLSLNYAKDHDIFAQVDLVKKKLDLLMKEIENKRSQTQNLGETTFQGSNFQLFLESQLSPENMRLKQEAGTAGLASTSLDLYDAEDNNILTASDIKFNSKKLVDSKTHHMQLSNAKSKNKKKRK